MTHGLVVTGLVFTKTPLVDGWGIIKYTRDTKYPPSNEAWYYLHHCDTLCYGAALKREVQCSVCMAEIPEHFKGLINLCAWEK
ncbi:hypothetical protein LCGC14_0207770 [marine sediment metagenome]|uniref:Uncharacterized protein n=1 Tax=marine sediment metagenome TaxID=412755 RepID=A0A0F9X0L6_9ZZZZ